MIDQGTIIECLIKGLPNSDQISEITFRGTEYVYFSWRGNNFRVTALTMSVEEVDGKLVSWSDLAAVIEELLKRVHVELLQKKSV